MVERIPPDEALRRMSKDGWTYVDVRSVPEFEGGHPMGAYNVPLMHAGAGPNGDFLGTMTRHFAFDAKLVLGCQAGGRSLRAAEMLTAAGFTSIVDQRAGWGGARGAFGGVSEPGWEEAGLPASTETEPGRSWGELAAKA